MEKILVLPQKRTRADECLVEFITPNGESTRVSARIMDGGMIRTNLSVPGTWRMNGVIGHDGEVLPTKTITKRIMRNPRPPVAFQAPMKYERIKR